MPTRSSSFFDRVRLMQHVYKFILIILQKRASLQRLAFDPSIEWNISKDTPNPSSSVLKLALHTADSSLSLEYICRYRTRHSTESRTTLTSIDLPTTDWHFKGTGTRDLIWLKVVSLDRSWLAGLTDELKKFLKCCFIFFINILKS